MRIRPKFIYILFLVIVVFGIYLPSLNHDFVNWDDDVHVTENLFVQGLDTQHLKDIARSHVLKIYIPLTSLFFAVEYHFFKDDPFIYHLDNVLLLLVVTFLVCVLASRCGLSQMASFIAAIIFGLHPMHVESVAWITERKDVLFSVFYLLSLLLYCRYLTMIKAEGENVFKAHLTFASVVVCGILSMLAKPMALSLPLILGLLDWFFKRQFSRRLILEKVYCGIFLLPIIWVTYASHARGVSAGFFDGILMWVWCFVFYIQKFFFPSTFALFYQRPMPFQWTNPVLLLTVFFFIGLIASLVYFRRRRLYLFCFLFYFLTIFFLLRFDASGDANFVADRFMYLPSVGWCLLIGYGCTYVHKRSFHPIGKIVLYVLILLALVLMTDKTTRQIKVWRNSFTLWQNQLKAQPLIATDLVYRKLARAYMDLRTFDVRDPLEVNRAKEWFELAARIKPDFYAPYMGLGELYLKRNDYRNAKINFKKVLERNPDYVGAYYYLGRIYYEEGNRQEGFDNFAKAMELRPDYLSVFDEIENFYLEYPQPLDFKRLKERYGGKR